MSQLDALKLAEAVRARLVDFSLNTCHTRDEPLMDICRSLWSGPPSDGGLLSDLWIEGAFPAEPSDKTLADLARDGTFDPWLQAHLDRRGAFPGDRALYAHQLTSLQYASGHGPAGARPAVVVTAPTGAGKTEAFLLPVLNSLVAKPRGDRRGVRCLVLYPMNALVNDQVERLYDWLQGQDRITLFHFTSETPEDKRAANKAGIHPFEPCRMRTRQEARGHEDRNGQAVQNGPTPDILITNYSMLEYMLCRPQDNVFFGDALEAVVLDEAHLYTGTLAAEITLLLRRVLERCGRTADEVLQIATSATLGSGDPEELRTFASRLFSREAATVHVVQGRRTRIPLPEPAPPAQGGASEPDFAEPWLTAPTITVDASGVASLAEDPEACRLLRNRLDRIVGTEALEPSNEETAPARLLRHALGHAPLIHQLSDLLWEWERLPLPTLAELLWGQNDPRTQAATIALLQLGATARDSIDALPVVPHRLHLLTRSPEGVRVCLNKHCTAPEARKWGDLGAVDAGGHERCRHCDAATLSIYRCDNCGEVALAGVLQEEVLRPANSVADGVLRFSRQPQGDSGRVVQPDSGRLSGSGAEGDRLYEIGDCPNCGGDYKSIVPLTAPMALAMSIVAETVLAESPELPSPDKSFLPAGGRRLLAFSDSRAEAARLGPRLTQQHETQLIRAAIVRTVEQRQVADAETLRYLEEGLAEKQRRLDDTDSSSPLARLLEQEIERTVREIASHREGGSIGEWARSLAKQPLLAQVLDPESGRAHRATEWRLERWEDNRKRVQERSGNALMQELARPSRRSNALETLGLIEVTYPGLDGLEAPPGFLGNIGTEELRQRLRDIWTGLLAALMDTLRTDGVITMGDDADRQYPYGAYLVGNWASESSAYGSSLLRFVGETPRQRRRVFAAAVLKACGLPAHEAEEMAPDLLRAAFQQLREHAPPADGVAPDGTLPWLQWKTSPVMNGNPCDAIQIVMGALGLRRPQTLYRCSRTGHIYPRSVAGCAPETGCEESLVRVSHEQLDGDARVGRVRREYRHSPVFERALWAEEHSAQLAPEENRRLQDLFKAGVRNILSATTTLELGIDIGGLNAVLMSNVPPGKANYLQRAGRAGRRADGSSLVVTFARPRPFDREVFQRFGDYLGRDLRRPSVLLDRDRVVQRHLHAWLLGRFFQTIYPADMSVGAMAAFGRIGLFCGRVVPPKWDVKGQKPVISSLPPTGLGDVWSLPWWEPRPGGVILADHFLDFLEWVRKNPETFQPIFAGLMEHTNLAAALGDWDRLLEDVRGQFTKAVAGWNEDYDKLQQGWDEADGMLYANALHHQMRALAETTVIEELSDRRFLPRYSFPVGLARLQVAVPDENRPGRVRMDDQARLERSSIMALREYVPGSQILVGGRVVTSRGILKHWTGTDITNESFMVRGQLSTCMNGHVHYVLAGDPKPCPLCAAGPSAPARRMLFPKQGFNTAAWDPPHRGTEIERVGTAEIATATLPSAAAVNPAHTTASFGDVSGLSVMYLPDGELLVYNQGEYEQGFAICLRCGYAESEKKRGEGALDLPQTFRSHAPLSSPSRFRQCPGAASPLRNQVLAAREFTDVLMVDFSGALGAAAKRPALTLTLGHALQQAGARLLDLDSREIGVMSVASGPKGSAWGVVLYDTAAGGAGHVLDLFGHGRAWLEKAHEALFVNADHDRHCETACLDCLLTFEAQSASNAGLLRRREALEYLDALLHGSTSIPEEDGEGPCAPPPTDEPRPSNEDRLRAAAARR